MEETQISASSRRWAVIFIFAAYSLTSAFQWIEFAIVPAVFQEYYNIEFAAIAWTSQIYMATFIPLVFPATWLIEQTGLRNIALIGSFINALGSVVKCLGTGRESWWIVFTGQFFSACGQCFILELPPKIAAIWFPSSEISTATSIGVFGNQLGVALGFFIPPKIIAGPRKTYSNINGTVPGSYPEDWSNLRHGNETAAAAVAEVKDQIFFLYALFGAICVFLFILVLLVFRDKPKTPANRASIKRSETLEKTESSSNTELTGGSSVGAYVTSIKKLLKDGPFLLLIVSYGLNVGCYYAISTLLVRIIKPTFYDELDNKGHSDEFLFGLDEQIGAMGLVMVVAGLVGSLLGGLALDKFKKFKLTTLITYIFSLVFMALFTYMIDFESLELDFFFIGALGFFMTGYLPIGFEFGAEITYPESEASSSGLLNCAAQVFGLIVTSGCTRLIDAMTVFDDDGIADKQSEIRAGWYANVAMVVSLLVGTGLTALIKEDLKRQRAEHAEQGSDTTDLLLGSEKQTINA